MAREKPRELRGARISSSEAVFGTLSLKSHINYSLKKMAKRIYIRNKVPKRDGKNNGDVFNGIQGKPKIMLEKMNFNF